MSFFGIKVCVFLKQQDESALNVFQGLGENACLLQPAFIEKYCTLTRPLMVVNTVPGTTDE